MKSRSSNRVLLFLALAIATTAARAQGTLEWSHTDGPGGTAGVTVQALTIHASGRYFALTKNGALFSSDDDGDAWQRIVAIEETGKGAHIVIGAGGEIYVSSHHLFRSTDAGATWSTLIRASRDTSVLAACELRSGRLLASVGNVYGNGGIVVSDDRGATWTVSSQNLGAHRPHSFLEDARGMIYGPSADHAMISSDRGATWRMMTLGLLPLYQFRTGVLGPGDLLHIADVTGAIARSSDAGESWTVVSQPGPGLLRGISPRGHMYAAPGSRRSIDSGRTWRSFFDGDLEAIAFRGADEIVAAIGGVGLVRSLDAGTTWRPMRSRALTTRISAIDVGSDGDVAAVADGAVWLSSDRGTTWRTPSAQPPGYVLAVLAGDETLAGTDSGLHLAVDGAAAWKRLSIGDSTEPAICVIERIDGAIYAGTLNGQVFVRTADVCNALPIALPSAIRAIVRTLAGHVMVAAGDEIHLSLDGGQWQSIRPDSTTTLIHTLAVDAIGMIFAGVDGGIVGSDDGGFTWRKMDSGLDGTPVRSIAADPDGFVFASSDRGISTLVLKNRTWRPMIGQPGSRIINALAVVPGRTLLAGSDGDGIFQGIYYWWAGVAPEPGLAPIRCEPNPVTSRASIVIPTETRGRLRVLLRDRIGRLRSTIFDGILDGGESRIGFETEGLASGIWLVEVIDQQARRVVPVIVLRQ